MPADERIVALRVKAAQALAVRRGTSNRGVDRNRIASLCREFMVPVPADEQPPSIQGLKSQHEDVKKRVFEGWLSDAAPPNLVGLAEVTAILAVCDGLHTSQIRKFLDGVKQVSARLRTGRSGAGAAVEMLKIPLVYVAARQKKEALLFTRTCMDAIDRVRREGGDIERDWEAFERFVEAVVAYHKFYGGED